MIYKQFRKIPGLDYKEFKNKFEDLEFDKNSIKNIYIYKGDKCELNKIYFYYADNPAKIKRIIKIPIDIELESIPRINFD